MKKQFFTYLSFALLGLTGCSDDEGPAGGDGGADETISGADSEDTGSSTDDDSSVEQGDTTVDDSTETGDGSSGPDDSATDEEASEGVVSTEFSLEEIYAFYDERCLPTQMQADMFKSPVRRLTGRVVSGSLVEEDGQEALQQTARLGYELELNWEAGAKDGDRVPVSGWVYSPAYKTLPDVYRCFSGELQMRITRNGRLYYLFAGNQVSEGFADGSCGEPIPIEDNEFVAGCLPDEY